MAKISHRAILFFLLGGIAFAVRPGDFTVLGPGGGGAMFNPTISPHDPNTALVSCDMTGSYITHDGGQTWRMFNLRGVTRFFVFDPTDPKIIYAQGIGLWRSTDGGETWSLIYPNPSQIKNIVMRSDHADEELMAQPDPLGTITALAVDPSDSKILYAAAEKDRNAILFLSRDWGVSWTLLTTLPEGPQRIWIDPRSPRDSRTLYLTGKRFVAIQSAAGLHSFPAPKSVSFTSVSLGFTSAAEPMMYATSDKGIFISKDGARNWHAAVLPGSGATVRAIATSRENGNLAYASYSGLSLDGKKWMGVAKTRDAGATWELVWKEADAPAPNVHDAWITPAFGVDWGENPLEIGVSDRDPKLVYATDLGRTMKTSDGGATWSAVYSHRVGDQWSSTGLDVTNVYGIHFDPFNPARQFLAYTDIGLFRSEDAGKSWQSSTTGVPREWRNTTYWLAFDPKVSGRMWSVNSGTHDLPRPKMWRHADPAKYKGGVCLSEDGGKTWRKSDAGMEETAATHIVLDPKSPVDARILYVAGYGRGVYKSSDGGKTWALKNQGITQTQPFAWRMTLAPDGTLYVVIARRSENGSIGNSGDGALYRSKDRAEHWEAVQLPSGVNGPNGLAVDPKSPERLYLAAWARASGTHGDGGGIFLSEDAGHTWRQIFERDRHVYDVTIDPNDRDILYAAGFESSAWRSTDRGEHWSRIPGFNFKWAYRVIPDPVKKEKIYISTFGGSLWHGSVTNADAPLDIATPELQPGH